jgi:tape measure domain-containing protein
MAEVRYRISAEDNTKQAVNSASNNAKNLGDTFNSVAAKITIVAGAFSLIGGKAIESAASYEKNSVAFESMLGSMDKAKTLLKEIETFSASTPLTMPGLENGAKRLIAFGTSSDIVIEKMRNLGNAAMGNEQTMARLVDAYGKVQAKGKASMEEINRFTEAGVPLMAELAKNIGVTTEEIIDMTSKGKIGFDDIDEAITSLTTNGGKFAGMLEKMSQTTAGKISTMLDNFNLAAKALGDRLLPVTNTLVDSLTSLAQEIANNEALMMTLADIGNLLAGVFQTAINVLGVALRIVGALGMGFKSMVDPVTVLGVAFSRNSRLVNENIQKIDTLKTKYDLLSQKQNKTAEETDELKKVTNELNAMLKTSSENFDIETASIEDTVEAIRKLKVEKQQVLLLDLNKQRQAIVEQMGKEKKNLEDLNQKYQNAMDLFKKYGETFDKENAEMVLPAIDAQKGKIDELNQKIKEVEEQSSKLMQQMSDTFSGAGPKGPEAGPKKEEIKNQNDLNKSMGDYLRIIEMLGDTYKNKVNPRLVEMNELNKQITDIEKFQKAIALIKPEIYQPLEELIGKKLPDVISDVLGTLKVELAELQNTRIKFNIELSQQMATKFQDKKTIEQEDKQKEEKKQNFFESDAFKGFIDTLSGFARQIESVSMIMDPLTTILSSTVAIISGPLNSALEPVVGALMILGETLGQVLIPVIKLLEPVIKFLAEAFILLYNFAIKPFANALIFVIKTISGFVTGIVNGIVDAINFLLGWAGVNLARMSDPTAGVAYLSDISMSSLTDKGSAGINKDTGSPAQYSANRQITVNVNIYTDVIAGPQGTRELALLIRDEIYAAEALGR